MPTPELKLEERNTLINLVVEYALHHFHRIDCYEKMPLHIDHRFHVVTPCLFLVEAQHQ